MFILAHDVSLWLFLPLISVLRGGEMGNHEARVFQRKAAQTMTTRKQREREGAEKNQS